MRHEIITLFADMLTYVTVVALFSCRARVDFQNLHTTTI